MLPRIHNRLLVLLLSVVALPSQFASANEDSHTPQTVWVFTTEQLPTLRHLDLASEVFVLDDIEPTLSALSFRFPGSEEKARARANTLLNSSSGLHLLDELKSNSNAVAMAWQSGIAKLPAVLVDRMYVVYGEYDIGRALQRVAHYRNNSREGQAQ